ncbi:MAG: ABC transporter permease [Tenericutes bacterium]|nr:ABC transporter permease [Mycoplasmatota bacterium]
MNKDNIPEEYKPISMWGYFGYEILFSLPIIGIILLIVFSLGGTKNINLKNFARSYFCIIIIISIVLIILLSVVGLDSVSSMLKN